MLSFEDLQHRLKMWRDVETRTRSFFTERGFTEVRTPLLVSSPGMEPNLDPLEVSVNNESAALITSPEYAMKKLIGMGMDKIFTITPVFRNHEKGQHNRPEFLMLEWYAPGSYEDLLKETELLLQSILEDSRPWPRYTHQEAKVDSYGDPHVEETRFFVTRFPVKEASLARISSDGLYAERFEAFGDGLELCNGFAELTDADEQRKRFFTEQAERKEQGKTVFPIDEEFLSALTKIQHPVYGNALGLDRLVMLKYGVRDINDIHVF